jgi:Domain of unknown function (DUF4234)
MADEVQIRGTSEFGKLRHPLGVVGLIIVTLGIYFWVWYYKINREMATIGRAHGTEECGTSPGTSLLAVTLGVLVIVPPFVSVYKTCARLTASERVTGTPQGMEAGLLFLLWILISPIGHYIFQSNLNKVLREQADAVTEAAPAPTPAV